MTSWREKAGKVIAEVLKETEGQPPKERLKAVRDAYPFGMRQYYPYQVWLQEVRNAKRIIEGLPPLVKTKEQKEHTEVEGQMRLFE